jgi:hypothetical protein
MRITMEVREDAFRKHKTAEQIWEEVRDGATMLWLARGDLEPAEARGVVEPVVPGAAEEARQEPTASVPPAEGAPAQREPMVYDFLILGPNVGEDSDFERKRHPPREQPEWDT